MKMYQHKTMLVSCLAGSVLALNDAARVGAGGSQNMQ
jgi:hypothetical protein